MNPTQMLPLPSADLLIPKDFSGSSIKTSLTDKIDTHLTRWAADAQVALRAMDPSRCPEVMLGELGWLLQAGIFEEDDESTKRQKIANAWLSHTRRGTWLYDIEPKIFSVTGITPVLFSSMNDDYWVRSGGNPYPTNAYWSIRGGGATDPLATGMIRAGSGNDPILGMVIQVDLGSSTLTAAQIEQIITNLTDDSSGPSSMPAYFRAFLGYTSGGGFVVYAGGQIN